MYPTNSYQSQLTSEELQQLRAALLAPGANIAQIRAEAPPWRDGPYVGKQPSLRALYTFADTLRATKSYTPDCDPFPNAEISAAIVSRKAARLPDARQRSLLYFIQTFSREPGGLKQLANNIIAEFPERLGTESMRKLGTQLERIYSAGEVERVRSELRLVDAFHLKGEVEFSIDDLYEPEQGDFSDDANRVDV